MCPHVVFSLRSTIVFQFVISNGPLTNPHTSVILINGICIINRTLAISAYLAISMSYRWAEQPAGTRLVGHVCGMSVHEVNLLLTWGACLLGLQEENTFQIRLRNQDHIIQSTISRNLPSDLDTTLV